jgi:hypothetical protein
MSSHLAAKSTCPHTCSEIPIKRIYGSIIHEEFRGRLTPIAMLEGCALEDARMTIQKILGRIAHVLFGPAHSEISQSREPQLVAIKARKIEDSRVTHSTAA